MTVKIMNEMLIKTHIDVPGYQVDCRLIEKNEILNTGGGVLNAISNFSNEPFLIVNPDTIWNFTSNFIVI